MVQSAYRVAFLLGMVLFGAAFAGGVGYVLATKGRLPEVSASHLTQAGELFERGDLHGRPANTAWLRASIRPTRRRPGCPPTCRRDWARTPARSTTTRASATSSPTTPPPTATWRWSCTTAAATTRPWPPTRAPSAWSRATRGPTPGIGEARLDQNRLPEAAEALQAGLDRDPGNAGYHNSLGVVSALRGRKAEAVAHFEQAVRLQPGAYDANLQRARSELAASSPAP